MFRGYTRASGAVCTRVQVDDFVVSRWRVVPGAAGHAREEQEGVERRGAQERDGEGSDAHAWSLPPAAAPAWLCFQNHARLLSMPVWRRTWEALSCVHISLYVNRRHKYRVEVVYGGQNCIAFLGAGNLARSIALVERSGAHAPRPVVARIIHAQVLSFLQYLLAPHVANASALLPAAGGARAACSAAASLFACRRRSR